MTRKRALITGITGQDGSYLAELLLQKDYEVYGIVRRSSSFNTARIDDIYQDPHDPNYRMRLVYGDLNDASSLNRILRMVKPDEIYNLGAQSHVRVSFDVPEYTAEITGLGTVRMLEAIRESGIQPRFYQASSSELFGHLGLDWKKYVELDPRDFRPAEVDELRGDMTKAKTILKWEPKVKFAELVRMMVDADLRNIRDNGDQRGDSERHS